MLENPSQPHLTNNLGPIDAIFKGLDLDLMKRLQNLTRLINDFRQKNQELLDYIDSEYSNPEEKQILLKLLEFTKISYDDTKPFESFVTNLK